MKPEQVAKKGLSTRCVHAGEHADPATGAVGTPIFQNTTYLFPDPDHPVPKGARHGDYYIYTRFNNPTIEAVEAKVASLEGAEAAVAFASGMAAISTLMLTLCKEGGHVVTAKDLYGGTFALMKDYFPKLGIKTSMVDTRDVGAFRKAVTKDTKFLYVESITNPTLKVADITSIAKVAHDAGVPLVVDATFATPVNQNPLAMGADIVLHSGTKYMSGHSDVTAGVVAGKKAFCYDLRDRMINYGGCMDPSAAWLLMRGIKTLEVRVQRQNASALRLARFLEKHPKVVRSIYPMLESHPDHVLAKRMLRGGGGMLSFELKDIAACRRFLGGLEVAYVAASLGGVDTLVTLPLDTTHKGLDAAARADLGIADGSMRMSVGIETVEDLEADLARGLEQV
jgi:cystathionine gamma-lyase